MNCFLFLHLVKSLSTCSSCGVRGIGQVAKLLGARAEVRLTRFRVGTVRRRRCRRECGLAMTVREQQGRRVKHDIRDSEMERYDMRTANTSSHTCNAVSVRHAKKLCQKNVRATRRVCTHHAVFSFLVFVQRNLVVDSLVPWATSL